jgi:hypothetical protein
MWRAPPLPSATLPANKQCVAVTLLSIAIMPAPNIAELLINETSESTAVDARTNSGLQ